MNRPLRVIIADDHAFIRAGLCRCLDQSPDIQVVGEAENGLEAVELVEKFLPDVLILDNTFAGWRAKDTNGRTH